MTVMSAKTWSNMDYVIGFIVGALTAVAIFWVSDEWTGDDK